MFLFSLNYGLDIPRLKKSVCVGGASGVVVAHGLLCSPMTSVCPSAYPRTLVNVIDSRVLSEYSETRPKCLTYKPTDKFESSTDQLQKGRHSNINSFSLSAQLTREFLFDCSGN